MARVGLTEPLSWKLCVRTVKAMSHKRKVGFGSGDFVNLGLCICGILALIYFRDFLAAGLFLCYFAGSIFYVLFKAVVSLEEEVKELQERVKGISRQLEQHYTEDSQSGVASDSEPDSIEPRK
jgi:Na+/melibiose symporter-like transporter